MKNKLAALLGLVVACGSGLSQAAVYDTCQPWLVSPYVGIAPSKFKKSVGLATTIQNNTTVTVATPPPPGATQTQLASANFGRLFNLPVTFGADVGYLVADNFELFLGYGYTFAKAKKFLVFSQNVNNVNYVLRGKFKDYNNHIGYVGARRYFDIECNWTAFMGLKLGASYHTRSNGTLSFDNGVTLGGKNSFVWNGFSKKAGLVVGPQAGVDYRINRCYSLFVAAEALYKTGYKASKNNTAASSRTVTVLNLTTTTNVQNLNSQATKNNPNLWTFPIVFGLRFKM